MIAPAAAENQKAQIEDREVQKENNLAQTGDREVLREKYSVQKENKKVLEDEVAQSENQLVLIEDMQALTEDIPVQVEGPWVHETDLRVLVEDQEAEPLQDTVPEGGVLSEEEVHLVLVVQGIQELPHTVRGHGDLEVQLIGD